MRRRDRPAVHLDADTVRRSALWVAIGACFTLVGSLAAGPGLAGMVDVAVLRAVVTVTAVLSWAVGGVLGSAPARRSGHAGRSDVALGTAMGAALGYLAVPGLLQVVGLLSVAADPARLVAGPLLSCVLAGLVAATAALVSPIARSAPYAAPTVRG